MKEVEYIVEVYTSNGKKLFQYITTFNIYLKIMSCSKDSTFIIQDKYYLMNNRTHKIHKNKEIVRIYLKQICRKVSNL